MSEIKLQWEPRVQQIQINNKFEEVVKSNKKFFFIDAPVGIGKSYAIMMMANKYQEIKGDDSIKFDVITNTKILQDQYLRDFDQMRSVKGVDNYYCQQHRCNCSEGIEIGRIKDKKCFPCSYKVARKEFLDSDIGVLNFHLFINYWEYSNDMMLERNSRILFVDEAHSFEETYCNFIDAHLSKKYLADLDIWRSEWEEQMLTIRTVSHFANFVRNFVIEEILLKVKEMESNVSSPYLSDTEKIKILKDYKHLKRVKCKYSRLLKDEENWRSNWVIQINKEDKDWVWSVEAIWAKDYLSELWANYDQVVFLSGTILDKKFFSELMGCSNDDSIHLTIESPFPVENRMIVFQDVDKLSFNRKREAFENMIPEINSILERHNKDKGIIHTTNYEISKWVEKDILDKEGRLLTHDKFNKNSILEHHTKTSKPTVLVSPSMINGVDLKDELSRFQIIIKVPYPNLGSIKVERRMKSNGKWYSWKTLCDIIQSYGRSIRSENDYAITYILDSNFQNLLDRVKIPDYLNDAILFLKK